jgi:hypothetical protein
MSDNQNEKSFNEDELKDIMDEIESLEEDYGEVEEEVAAAPAEEAPVQEAAEAEPVEEDPQEVEAAQQEPEPVAEEEPVVQEAAPAEEVNDVDDVLDGGDDDEEDDDIDTVAEPGEEAVAAPKNNVVAISKPVAQPVAGDSPVQLNAQGQMNLAMNFEFNGAQSNIVLENGCVKINLPGVNVVFDEKAGCQIVADNGMTFQLPLAVKKAS